MTVQNAPIELTASTPEALLDEFAEERIHVAVHDASRLAWNASVPVPTRGRLVYELTLELEVPMGLLGTLNPWEGLQTYARLDGADDGVVKARGTPEELRRGVVGISFKLARARDGFVRHCTLVRTSGSFEENHGRALILWISAAQAALTQARTGLLRPDNPRDAEQALADEFLSGQLWSVLTDCARALFDTQRILAERSDHETQMLDPVEQALSKALQAEIAYREQVQFAYAEPANALQLERLVSRLRGLKKHFERVLFLELESYQVLRRLGGWFSAIAAMLAYLWFFFWQVLLERHRSPATIGSGVVAFAFITAIAYASRERIKEAGRNWLAGRAQSIFAQRVVRYRLPPSGRQRGALVAFARESFSQSIAQRPDPVNPESGTPHDVTIVRFSHHGSITHPEGSEVAVAGKVRLVYRLDLSPLLPRLHDAVRGFATPDPKTGRIVILDVPRNYELSVRAGLRWAGVHEETRGVLVLNKNGLLRVEERG